MIWVAHLGKICVNIDSVCTCPYFENRVAHANVMTGESKELTTFPLNFSAQGIGVIYDKRDKALTFIEKRTTQEVIRGCVGTLSSTSK